MPIINCALTCFDLKGRACAAPDAAGRTRHARRPSGDCGSRLRACDRYYGATNASKLLDPARFPEAARCARLLLHYIQGNKVHIDKHVAVSSMNNLDLSRSQLRESRIKLHGPEAFEGMRKAG